jgi:hypothetical protein
MEDVWRDYGGTMEGLWRDYGEGTDGERWGYGRKPAVLRGENV